MSAFAADDSAIENARRPLAADWTAFGQLGLGYDSNVAGLPSNFFAASQQLVGIGLEPMGSSLKRSAAFVQGALGAEYSRPLAREWSLFTGGELRGRGYRHGSDFNIGSGEVHFGGARDAGDDQYRATVSYSPFSQEGAAPGDPRPTSDRRIAGINLDWRHAIDTKTQVGLAVQVNDVRFPKRKLEDLDQLFLGVSWLKSFEGRGSPLLYLTGFVTEDRARNEFDNGARGTSTRSRNLAGVRSHFQYALTPKLQAFSSVAAIYRRDKDDWARSNLVQNGRDVYGEVALGLAWTFRDKCVLRLQYAYSRNASNIDIYDFNRNEISSTIRCEMI